MCIPGLISGITAGSTIGVTSATSIGSTMVATIASISAMSAITAAASIGGTIASSVVSGVSASRQADLAEEQGRRQATVAEHNAALADAKSLHARARGQAAGSRAATRAGRFAGKQRALAAAAGLDPSSGTAAHSIDDTKILGRLDAANAINAGLSESAGFTAQAFNERARASIVGVAPSPALQIAGAATGGASAVASTWYKYRTDDEKGLFDGS